MKTAALVTLASLFPLGFAPAQAPLSTAEIAAARYAPVVRVVDTVSSLGPLSRTPQTITLVDLVHYHGHPCDGLVVAAAGVAYGLAHLFPEGVVDRTELVAAANASPCYGDATAYLTGTRARYGTLVVDKRLGDAWILHRRSTGATVRVSLKPGIKPAELPGLEATLRKAGCDWALMSRVVAVQNELVHRVLAAAPATVFNLDALPAFPYAIGSPRADTLKALCVPMASSR
jgi:formylmethanofuran dehydrogenase subunit E